MIYKSQTISNWDKLPVALDLHTVALILLPVMGVKGRFYILQTVTIIKQFYRLKVR